MAEASEHDVDNPCGEFGPTQRAALVWFFATIVIGALLTFQFAKIDTKMYNTNAEYLDYDAYRDNRLSQTTVGTERSDGRAHGGYAAAVTALSEIPESKPAAVLQAPVVNAEEQTGTEEAVVNE